MSTKKALVFTPRDLELLTIIGRTSPTLQQLLKVSSTFDRPFTSLDTLRLRMTKLAATGWLQKFRFATTGPGAVNYYRLTPAGYRRVVGLKAKLPSKSHFRPISLGLQSHFQALSEFLIHFHVGAHRAKCVVNQFFPENDLVLRLDGERQLPDAAVQLLAPHGHSLNFLIEFDNGTEPVCSGRERDSIQKKVRFYERYQDRCDHRFRVLFVTAKQSQRHLHITALARQLAGNANRCLIYSVSLPSFVSAEDCLRTPLFLDHRGRLQPLVPPHILELQASPSTKQRHSQPVCVCAPIADMVGLSPVSPL